MQVAVVMTLEDELLAIDGVTDVIVSIGDAGPVSIQVEVVPGADRSAVTESVSRILERHGLDAAFAPTAAPTAPQLDVVAAPRPARRPDPVASRRRRTVPDPVAPTDPAPDPAPIPSEHSAVASVAVSQGSRGIEVAVKLRDGRKLTASCAPTDTQMWQAICDVLYRLDGRAGPHPVVESVEWVRVGDVDSVVTVVSVGDHRRLGAAAATPVRALAVARALRVALR